MSFHHLKSIKWQSNYKKGNRKDTIKRSIRCEHKETYNHKTCIWQKNNKQKT